MRFGWCQNKSPKILGAFLCVLLTYVISFTYGKKKFLMGMTNGEIGRAN